jgi:hypothetical protein
MRHVATSIDGRRTLCARVVDPQRDLPLDLAHYATCRTCIGALRGHDRAVPGRPAREDAATAAAILRGAARGIDGIERLPSEARASLRRKGIRLAKREASA